MQFKVPQFLDIEDKIFGPFTFSQFVYLCGGGAICYVLYKWLGLYIGAIPILAVGGLAAALVWYRPNGKPFINLMQSAISYFFQTKLYIWKKGEAPIKQKKVEMAKQDATDQAKAEEGRLNQEKLRDLGWSLDVLDLKK